MTLLREQHRVTPMVKPIVSNLMKPHLAPTWTSMDIDSYIRTVWRELRRLDKFITPVNDVVENRIDANLVNAKHLDDEPRPIGDEHSAIEELDSV